VFGFGKKFDTICNGHTEAIFIFEVFEILASAALANQKIIALLELRILVQSLNRLFDHKNTLVCTQLFV
jgi:hypothetical protein